MMSENPMLVTLELSQDVLAFLALYAHKRDMKIEEAINDILICQVELMDLVEIPEGDSQ
jgi:hypothetical protein